MTIVHDTSTGDSRHWEEIAAAVSVVAAIVAAAGVVVAVAAAAVAGWSCSG